MTQLLAMKEHMGLYSTILPMFDPPLWQHIVSPTGFVWIDTPFVDLSQQIETVIGRDLFGRTDLDLSCSIVRMAFDVSIPASDFLQFVEKSFPGGLDFLWSHKHQPKGLRLSSISKSRWPEIMEHNEIKLVFHRPAAGEPALVTSNDRSVIASMIDRFSSHHSG